MLSTLFITLIAIAFAVAAVSTIATWRQYAGGWEALDAELAQGPLKTRVLRVAVIEQSQVAAYAEVKAPFLDQGRPAFRPQPDWRAAA
jgi:hypothetical protein